MEDYTTYEQAVKLKELGFDWKCIHWYRVKAGHNLGLTCIYDTHNTSEKGIPSPTLAQAQKWLREKGIYLFVTMELSRYYWYIGKEFQIGNCNSYEEALSAGINKALEFLEKGEGNA